MSAPNPECPGCRALQDRVDLLEAELATIRQQLDRLSVRAKQNSKNSSRSPSSDLPDVAPSPSVSKPTGRKPGGQAGHEGKARSLKLSRDCHEVIPFFPSSCSHCHLPLSHDPTQDLPAPRRHQVLEIPPDWIRTIEYQCHAACCSGCGQLTFASLPDAVPTGLLGPRLQAVCSLLVGRHHLSRRGLQELLFDAGGEHVSLGALIASEARTTRALQHAFEQAAAAVASAAVAYVDETPWRQGSEKAWLWSASTHQAVLFRIDPRRSRAAFELLLPPRADGSRRTVVCDRYSAYQHLQGDERQVCWAHLLREFRQLSQMSGEEGKLGSALLCATGWLFELWDDYRTGKLDRHALQVWMERVQAQIWELLGIGKRSEHWRASPLGRELLKQWESLWTFVRLEGVEPTNNRAERAVRPGVLWRKNSYGNQGAGGRGFVEAMLTVVGSLRQQGRKVFSYLEAAIRAWGVGERAPSLLGEAAG